jgi:predicted DNA-binding protein YlxM (UPF0122 family)
MPLITYKGNGQYKELAIFADEDLINNKIALLTEIAKSNKQLNEINGRLNEIKAEYDKEKAANDKLVALRYELHRREKAEELRLANAGKLLNKKDKIEFYFSQGKSYDEIALLTEATPEYIYKVICNYRKRNKILVEKPTQSEIEETIKLGYRSHMSIEEIAALAKVSRQYVYKILKKNNMPYPKRKKS